MQKKIIITKKKIKKIKNKKNNNNNNNKLKNKIESLIVASVTLEINIMP